MNSISSKLLESQARRAKDPHMSNYDSIVAGLPIRLDFKRYAANLASHNAACEGFFGVMKRERINPKNYRTQDEARSDTFDYIERFHNPRMRRRLAAQDQRFSALLNRP